MSTVLLYQKDKASQQPRTLFLDLETFSELDIKKVGGYKYAENCEILLFAYAVNDLPAQVLDLTDPASQARNTALIKALIDSAGTIIAHNSMFDRVVLNAHGYKSHISSWQDTMVQALMHSLPAGLGDLCTYLGLAGETAKDVQNGKKLINLFCKPMPAKRKLRRATRDSHPSDWAMFIEYARRDVEAMRAARKLMPTCNGHEFDLWRLDQKINDRGIMVDTDFVNKIIDLVADKKAQLADETQEVTDGELSSTTKVAAMLNLLQSNFGISLPDLKKTTVEAYLDKYEDLMPAEAVQLLVNRCQASNSTVKKYNTMRDAVCNDGRLHGLLKFSGASRTGRWSGQLVQPQNLPRPHFDFQDTDYLIDLVKNGNLDVYTDDVINVAASCIRGALLASKGKKLVVSDLSAIEGRVLAWLAGEAWVLNAYREYDNGIGRDMYVRTYANSFKVTQESVTKAQRQMGKIQELALGYQGGVGAFVQFAEVYGIDLDELAEVVIPTVSAEILQRCESTYDWFCDNGKKPNMPKRTWVAVDALKVLWRDSHPKTQELWKLVDSACKDAINNKGRVFEINDKLKAYCSSDGLLRIKLPSGRYLCYPNAEVTKDNTIAYMGTCQTTRKWKKLYTYGGKLVENCIAHDTLVLTDKGAKPIQDVKDIDKVWDGVKWVSHKGLINKGEQKVIKAMGVYMTPDHKILTTEGWKKAANTGDCQPFTTDMHVAAKGIFGESCYGDNPIDHSSVYDLLDCGDLHRFTVIDEYGELLIVHNCTQAVARDVLAANMQMIDDSGYEILLSVHDELITEASDNDLFYHEHLSKMMATQPAWARDLPLAAEGYEGYFYRKD